MLEKVRAYAMEKYAEDDQAIEEFVAGFVKAAASVGPTGHPPGEGFFSRPRSGDNENLLDSLSKGIFNEAGKKLGGLSIAAGATALGSVYGSVHQSNLHSKFLQALEKAVNGNAILKQAAKARVLQYAESVFKFAPNVATDVNLLSSILANAIHGEGIDPMTIKTLTELEGKYRENHQFTPKTYI